MKNKIFALGILILAASFGCQTNEQKSSTTTAEGKALTVKAITLQKKTFADKIVLSGSVESWEKIHLVPTSPGKIEKLLVDISSKVQEGDLIAVMDQTQLTTTKLQLEQLEKDFKRIDSLAKAGAIALQQYEQLKTNYEVTKKTYAFLEKNVFLKSPISGIVTEKYYNEGEMFSAAPNTRVGKAALVAIENLQTMKLLVDVPESHFSKINKSLSVSVYIQALGKTFPARISLIYPSIDPLSKTFKIEIAIQNSAMEIKPGMFARAEITLGDREALAVPQTALLKQQGSSRYYIYRLNNNVAEQIFIDYRIIDNEYTEVISDKLNENDTIITVGIEKLVDGAKVTLVN